MKKKNLNYAEYACFFKALADENRLQIINLLSCQEICACEILADLKISQPTLSHHMKILCDCSLVNSRKDGKWTYYHLNKDAVKPMNALAKLISSKIKDCKRKAKKGECE